MRTKQFEALEAALDRKLQWVRDFSNSAEFTEGAQDMRLRYDLARDAHRGKVKCENLIFRALCVFLAIDTIGGRTRAYLDGGEMMVTTFMEEAYQGRVSVAGMMLEISKAKEFLEAMCGVEGLGVR